jgi:hypothetical protein
VRALRVPAGSTSTGAPVEGSVYATAGAVGGCIVPSYPYHLSTAEVYTAAAAITQVERVFLPWNVVSSLCGVVVNLQHQPMELDTESLMMMMVRRTRSPPT